MNSFAADHSGMGGWPLKPSIQILLQLSHMFAQALQLQICLLAVLQPTTLEYE